MDYSDDQSDDTDVPPFTYPQVVPFYSSLRKNCGKGVVRKPLKKPIFRFQSVEEKHHGIAQSDDSLSMNSLSDDLMKQTVIHSVGEARDDKANDENKLNPIKEDKVGVTTPRFRTPFSAKCPASLVKRVPHYSSVFKVKEENDALQAKDVKDLDKYLCDKSSKRQEILYNGNTDKGSVRSGRVLRDVSNNGQNIQDKKLYDGIKLNKDTKGRSVLNKYFVEIPSAEENELNVPKLPSKTPVIGNYKASSLVSGRQYASENMKSENQEQHRRTPPKVAVDGKHRDERSKLCSVQQMEPSILYVNNVQYSVLSKLGQGGSSQVYQVMNKKTSSLFAVKCVNLQDADELAAKGYLKEIEILEKLKNSNRVIKLIDHEYLRSQEALYIVMEKGDTDLSTLLKHLSKSGDVSMPMVVYYWTEMLLAVREIHRLGIVHADLKPANFLWVCGRLKLIDFGIASAMKNDATSIFKNNVTGTCNYMSPEAIKDPDDSSRTKIGYKSDVWSLGCILYNLLYQKTPFQHITNSLLKLQVIANPLSKIEFPPVKKCPAPLMDALKSCLKYEAKKRPSVADLLAIDYI